MKVSFVYNPTTPSVRSIVLDQQIRLPRFQRKKSWDDQHRFELCISLFKGYPLGTIVIKKEDVDNKTIKWLLDGRQRRDTLMEMQNPDNIYRWAKTYLGIKNRDQPSDIKEKFDEKMIEYIQFDDEKIEVFPEEPDDTVPTDYTLETPVKFENNLKGLADLICNVHPMRAGMSNFGKPFFFKNYKTKYIVTDDEGKLYVDSDKLLKWLSAIQVSNIDELTVADVVQWFDNPNEDLEQNVKKNINGIKRSLKMVQTISEMMSNTNIQVVELDNSCSNSDARKIFEIINTQGVPLTGPEIMSAKPNWNVRVSNPTECIQMNVLEMYKALGTTYTDVVKWDVAATFTDRLDSSSDMILGNLRKISYNDTTREFDKKITSGFKLLSGRYLNSITKDDIDTLPNVIKDWNLTEFEYEITSACKLLLKDQPFKQLESYHISISDSLSYTIAINYLLLIIKKKNEINPHASGVAIREYRHLCRILYDRFVYEYITSVWKGSSDSRLSRNLNENYSDVFKPVPVEDWNKLIDEAFELNTISGQKISTGALRAMTVYFSMLRAKTLTLSEGESAEFDHIIPAAKFTTQSDDKFKESLYNYALLSPKLNKEKSDNTIEGLGTHSKSMVCQLEDLDLENIHIIKSPKDMDKLIQMRQFIVDDVKEKRQEFTEGSGIWAFD